MGILICLIIWYILGVLGFIHWWTHDNPLYTKDLFAAFIIGLMGPLSFIAGYCIHGREGRPLLKQRESKN